MRSIPTTTQLNTAIKADIEGTYGSNVPTFGKVFLRALIMAWAGTLKLFYLAIGSVQKNIFVDTADPEASGGTLERFGRVKLNRNPFPAQAGQYTIQVTGTIGATIAAQTTFKSNDDSVNPGKLFILDVAYTLVASPDTITVRALEVGLDSKMAIGEGMTATVPIALVNKGAVVTGEPIPPLAAEDIETYRQKAIQAYRTEPQGGAASDYRLWAADAQGVQQTYPYAYSGHPDEINLYVEATVLDSTDGKGTPSGALLTAVEAVVELDPDTTKPILERGRRPLGVFQVHYLPITPLNIDITIPGFVGVTADQETLILNAIQLALSTVRPFIAGADILSEENDLISVNTITSIILNAIPRAVFGAVILSVAGVPVSTYVFTSGNIPYLNTITYS